MKHFLIRLCKVYKGGSLNPFDKDRDEFSWYIWNRERVIVELSSLQCLKTQKAAENYFKKEIQAALDLFSGTPYGSDPSGTYNRYFSL